MSDRTEKVYRTVLVYCQHTGQEFSAEAEDVVTDMLTDLRHLADEYGVDFFASLDSSYEHYIEEKREDREASHST